MKTLFAIALFLAGTASAFGAGLGVEPVGYDWSGFYVGLVGGFGWGKTDFGDVQMGSPGTVPVGEGDIDGWLAGAQAGYNVQSGAWVFGLEADISAAGLDGERRDYFAAFPPTAVIGGTLDTDVEWLATVRGRIGHAFGNVLLFATGGVAFAGTETTSEGLQNLLGVITPYERSSSDTGIGLTLGAGGEVAIGENLSLKLEYRYVRIEDIEYHSLDDYLDPTVNADVDLELHTVMAGFNYRF